MQLIFDWCVVHIIHKLHFLMCIPDLHNLSKMEFENYLELIYRLIILAFWFYLSGFVYQ